MPGELDRKSDGTAAMFSVSATPWHREGSIIERPPATIAEALDLAGLDFFVDVKPVFVTHTGGEYAKVTDYQATFRTDTQRTLGIVGSRYTPLQNGDAFRIIEPLLNTGRAALETAGSLREGRDVWILVRFDINDAVVQEVFADEVLPFGLLSNNHAGERGVILQETPIRVVCANTLGTAHRSAIDGKVVRVRHTFNVELRTVQAVESLWEALIERYQIIARQYAILKRCFLSRAAFTSVVLDSAAPIQAQWLVAKPAWQQEQALTRARARRARIEDLWGNGTGHAGNESAWEAYNALVQSVDHDESLWPTQQQRTASLLDGSLAEVKQRVLDKLMVHASQNPGSMFRTR